MFESVTALVDEYADLETRLADPAVHTDQALARRLGRRYAELRPVVTTYRAWASAGDDLEAARELVADDPSFKAEVERPRAPSSPTSSACCSSRATRSTTPT